MAESLLVIQTRHDRSETVVTLSGECDLSNVNELDKAVHEILRSENRRIVLDVEHLQFAGVCALAPIETAITALQHSDGIVVVRARRD